MGKRKMVDYSYMQQFDIEIVPDRLDTAVYVTCKECGDRFGGAGILMPDPNLDVRVHDYMRQHLDQDHGGFTLSFEK